MDQQTSTETTVREWKPGYGWVERDVEADRILRGEEVVEDWAA